ncbi:hypothetical protein Noc_0567 [Nitrosococcus oceani ATCC 19707]|uniref:HEPN AbiU2-like domain-containing protein n=2 Tax=Nitrosococcus oceani TaxID=1229 RepID=Q3JDK9_NITOC|nr:hypothetical protein [Nitrosococcus oceani]ABA57087.1 hypothetical protein Noc_0567 [Nitrosococcus oceani ATCC 19707]EDZ65900.1 hypothetical protein NOC27_2580 [Nitrosococcus oceani AFC27]KFI20448.1 hypothetical protein IB75_02995 [Nitrosococcus oceani C-27]GEM19895.1 hypothetical protein NONS58_12940 [Nitrosococcus oceani]
MVNLEQILRDLDLSAIAPGSDKLDECRFFLSALKSQTERQFFRWYLSAYLGATYSYLEIKALELYFSSCDPENGESVKDEAGLSVLREYVRVFQEKKRPDFIKTSGKAETAKKLYEIRKQNTHLRALPIMEGPVHDQQQQFLIGEYREKGIPAVEFCEEVQSMLDQIDAVLASV